MTKQVVCSKSMWPNDRVFPWESGSGSIDFYKRCYGRVTFKTYARECPYYSIEDGQIVQYKTCCDCFNCLRLNTKGDTDE